METKKCTGCKQDKTLDSFCKNKANKDGLSAYCRKCASEKHYAKREHNNAVTRKYQQENYDKVYQASLDWIKAHPDHVRQRQAKYNRDRYAKDPYFAEVKRARTILTDCLKGGDDPRHRALEVLGFTRQQFCDYFKDDIAAFNASNTPIHIDHKIPWAWFKKGTPVHIVCDLRNLRLVTEEENVAKMAKVYTPVVPEYLALIKLHVIQPVRLNLY